MNTFPLLQLPDAALAAVAAAVMDDSKACDALRTTCARMCAAVDAQAASARFRNDAQGWRRGLSLDALRTLAARFPRAATVDLCSWSNFPEELARRLAALPDGCWPGVTGIHGPVAPSVAAQAARLCPNLRAVSITDWAPDAGLEGPCAALDALAAAGAPVDTLKLSFDLAACGGGAAARASASLARLGRKLRTLRLHVSCEEGAAGEGRVLPALAALTALEAVELDLRGLATPPLGAAWAPPQLKRLAIDASMQDDPDGAAVCAPLLRSGVQLPELQHLELKATGGMNGNEELDLADVAAACPRLKSLAAERVALQHSAGVLRHLTSLRLERSDALTIDLSRAAPQLLQIESNDWWHVTPGAGVGVTAHPALRSASLDMFESEDADGADEWMAAYTTLPRLDTLQLRIHHESFSAFASAAAGREPCRHEAGFVLAAAYLAHCTGLTRLELAPVFDVPLLSMMVVLGGAVGARLVVLELSHLALPESEDEAGCALRALPLFPRLERLTMGLHAKTVGKWGDRRYKGPVVPPLSALLAPVGALQPACAALTSIAIQLNRAEAAPGELEAVHALCRELSAANPGLGVTFKQGA